VPVLTKARSGLARAGATRSGYPALQGARVPLYALSGVARSGATRSNYTSNRFFVIIDGVPIGEGPQPPTGVRVIQSVEVHETLGAPTTARFRVMGMEPLVGQDVKLTIGSIHNLSPQFGGQILGTDLSYASTPRNAAYDVHCIDYTWGLNKRRVLARYQNQTIAAIAADLLATFTAGYTLHVDPDIGAEVLDEITFTQQDFTDALQQLVHRVGGYWRCSYTKVLNLFFEDASPPPRLLNAVHPTLMQIAVSKDLSQVLTRVTFEGGGPNSAAWIAAGETLIPLDGDPGWFQTTGGIVVSGPQRITYTTVRAGGGGSLVGPGAAPSGPPNVALLSGAGVTPGAHQYAVSYVTAAGESLPGPIVAITTGVHDLPTTAFTVSAPTLGTGPNPGLHIWGVAFLTASGETIIPYTVTASTGLTPEPETAPLPGTPKPGAGVDDGVHDYAVTFVTTIGETTPSPISGIVTAGHLPPPNTPVAFAPSTLGTGPEAGSHDYGVSFVTGPGMETTVDPTAVATKVTEYQAPPPAGLVAAFDLASSTAPATGTRQYVVTFVTSAGETTAGPPTVQHPQTLPTPYGVAVNVFQDGTGYGITGWQPGDTMLVACTYGADATMTYLTALGPSFSYQLVASTAFPTQLSNCVVNGSHHPDPGVKSIRIWVNNTTRNSGWIPATQFANIPGSSTGWNAAIMGFSPTPATWTPNPSYTHQTTAVSAIPPHPSGSGTRKVYRSPWGTTAHKLVGSVTGTATTFTDTVTDASLGAAAPTTNTAALLRNNLVNIPIGPEGVTQRKLWRSPIGSGTLKYLATLSNNTDTDYTDSTVDASLGVPAPVTNTATANQIPLSQIPRGDSNVIYRNLYRRSGGAGLRLLYTLTNNTATTFTDNFPNVSLGAPPPATSAAHLQRFTLANLPKGDSLVTGRRIYRSVAGGAGLLKVAATIADNTTTTWVDTVPDASLGANQGLTNTATTQQVAVSAIPIGAASVTGRKLYRTPAGSASLKLLTTLDATTATYTDTTPDASLGAAPPVTDTSGLTQPSGSVPQGATTLIVATTGAFSPTGGWALIGNGAQCIRYSGMTLSSLTGIPASGPGSILASISFNSTATVPPMLAGVPASGAGAIKYPILKGDPINLFVEVDDLEARAALAAMIGGDGIQVDHLQDRRLSRTEATARALAWLAVRRDVLLTLRYRVRDPNNRAGRKVLVNLGPPFNLFAVEFLIQSMTETARPAFPLASPTLEVTASSTRFTFDDLLRLIKKVA
jgi:hypothetical protein